MKSSARKRPEPGLGLKHDAELRRIAVLPQVELEPDAVSSARAELSRRHLAVPTPAEYWRDFPQEFLAVAGFCYACWAQTSEEAPATPAKRRRFGLALSGEVEPCATCGSVIQTQALWLGVPLIPLRQYRVVRSAAGKVRGRRLSL